MTWTLGNCSQCGRLTNDGIGATYLCLNCKPKRDLTQLHVKQLLKMLRQYRHWTWREDGETEFTLADVKAELAKREHVPNKKEGEEARRTKAKQGRKGRKQEMTR